MEKTFDVIGIGQPCVDYAMRVPDMPKADAGCRVLGTSWQGGGVVPTGLTAASRLGLRCALISSVGDDMLGQYCCRDLLDHGVDLSHTRIRENSVTDMAVILSDDQTHGRSILYQPGTAKPLVWGEIDTDFLRGAAYLYLGGCGEIEKKAAQIVKSCGGEVLIDASYGQLKSYEALLPLIDCFIGSAYLYRNCFQNDRHEENLRQIQAMGPDTVAFTFGSEGVRAVRGETYTEVPAFRVDTVDTLGAGDVFHGAFFYGLKHRLSLTETVRFASAVSAIKCTAPGGRAGIPTEKAVRQFLETGRIDRDEIQKRIDRYARGLDDFMREGGRRRQYGTEKY